MTKLVGQVISIRLELDGIVGVVEVAVEVEVYETPSWLARSPD